ncbi:MULTISPECIES: phage tail protein [unclassified Halomonas]|nr:MULTISPECIES: phage tail protein [unclassified Halomonas]
MTPSPPCSKRTTLFGTLLPSFTGGRFSFNEIRDMANQGNA